MKVLLPLWRIYAKGKPAKLVGAVEAATEAEALEKALKGSWKGFWGTDRDRPIDPEQIFAQG